MVNVVLGTPRGIVEQDSLLDSCYMLNKRITMEELRKAIKKIDRNEGIDPYNWHPCLTKSLKFFTLSLFLHLLNTCLEDGFRPFQQVSVLLLKKPEKRRQASAYRCISSASHADKLLEGIMDDRIRSLHFLNIEEQYGFRKGHSTMNSLYQLIY